MTTTRLPACLKMSGVVAERLIGAAFGIANLEVVRLMFKNGCILFYQ
jgi:hypothetical protein